MLGSKNKTLLKLKLRMYVANDILLYTLPEFLYVILHLRQW
jgi:hypothetical protein